MKRLVTKSGREEQGSLALEQILFIGAIVTMAVGLFAFYGNLGNYFTNFAIQVPTSTGNPGGSGG